MTADKEAITGYFDAAKQRAIAKYADAYRITESKALEALVKEAILKENEAVKNLVKERFCDEKIERLEKSLDGWVDVQIRCAEKTEKLEEQIAYLQQELDALKKTVKSLNAEHLSDERIAAVILNPIHISYEKLAVFEPMIVG